MQLLKNKSAMKLFYYLMSVDGDVSSDELKCFDEIGNEIDSDSFVEYRKSVIMECENQLKHSIDEEDYYDVVLESMDHALIEKTEDLSRGISSRLLVWDMLVIAHSNNNYSDFERRLIKHIVRILNVDQSVFLEMEQLIKTNISVDKELTWIKTTNRTYAEIAPIVNELENRRSVILTCVKELIEDEIYSSIEKVEFLPNKFMQNAISKVEEKVLPAKTEISDRMTKFAGNAKTVIGDATAPMTSEMGKQTKRLFNKFKSLRKNVDSDNSSNNDVIQDREKFVEE